MRKLLIALALLVLPTPAFAATVSTIAVAGSTVTVTTATSHGRAVNDGVCLSVGTCTVIETVPTATTYTFTQPTTSTVAVCASSCGTEAPAPHIIILDVSQPSNADMTVHYLLWLTTTKPIPASVTSAWKSGAGSAGATTPMNNALSAGSFLERNLTHTFPATLTSGAIQTFLQNNYTTQQAALASNTQPGQFYGSVWNGAAWGIQ